MKADIIAALPEEDQKPFGLWWQEMEASLGRDALQVFLIDLAQLHAATGVGRSAAPSAIDGFSSLTAFTERLKKQAGGLAAFAGAYLPCALHAFRIASCAEPYFSSAPGGGIKVDADVNSALVALKFAVPTKYAREWMPLAMRALMLLDMHPVRLAEVLRDLERLAAFLCMCQPKAKLREERYRAVLAELEACVSGRALPQRLHLALEEKAAMRAVCESSNLYKNKKAVELVLLRLDMALRDDARSVVHGKLMEEATVEHVLPQDPAADSRWLRDFSEAEREELTHSLGNLLLLAVRKNAKASRSDFEEKKRVYFRTRGDSTSSFPDFVVTSSVLGEQKWTPQVVRNRRDDLLRALYGPKGWRLE